MPKPRYIICSQGRIIDKFSGLVSHLNVIEELRGAQASSVKPGEQPPTPLVSLSFIVVWSRDDLDSDDDILNIDARMNVPGSESPKTLYVGEFAFNASKNYRLDVTIGSFPQDMKSGVLVLDSRIRKKGSLEWIAQSYEIPIAMEAVENPE